MKLTKDQEDLFVYLGALCFTMPKDEVDKIIEFRDKIMHKLERLDKIDNILNKPRLTRNISEKQSYCGYEVANCKYQYIYKFKKYADIEDYVDCDLTLAIDKLGELEDIYNVR